MLLGTVDIQMSEFVTGLFEEIQSPDEQIAFTRLLGKPAEGFRQRC